MIYKSNDHIMKKTLLLLKVLLESSRIVCTDIWLQYQKLYINKLNDKVDKYNNTYHKTIKMNSADINSSMYFDFSDENNDKDSRFEVDPVENIKI